MHWHRPQSRIGFKNLVWHEQDLNPGTHTFDTYRYKTVYIVIYITVLFAIYTDE